MMASCIFVAIDAKDGDVAAPRWAASTEELARLKVLNLLGEAGGELDPADERVRAASGLDDSELSAVWTNLRRQGFVIGLEALGGTTRYRLSDDGATEYQARVRRLSDPATTRWTLRSALINWAMANDGYEYLDAFRDDPRSVLEGMRQAEVNEVMAAAVYLKDRGLIDVSAAEEIPVIQLRITSDGQDAVDHYDGDIAEWSRRRGGAEPVIHTGGGDYINNSKNVQLMKHSPGGQQAQGGSNITPSEAIEVAEFVAALRKLLTVEDIPDERRADLAGLLDQVEIAAKTDRGAVRRAWEQAKAPLKAAGPTLTYLMTRLVMPTVFDDDPSAVER